MLTCRISGKTHNRLSTYLLFHILSSIGQHPTIQRANFFQEEPVGSQDAHDGRTSVEHMARESLTLDAEHQDEGDR